MYLKYLWKLLKHKWFVFLAGRKLGVNFWQLVIHDWSKFLPSEFGPYARFWDGGQENVEEYTTAWLLHMNRNPHHWQYWLRVEEGGKIVPNEMPLKYAVEMIADWSGAQRVYQGNWSPKEWYYERKDDILLHEDTKTEVAALIEIMQGYSYEL